MSLAAYRLKGPLLKAGAPFEAYLMAAMQVADSKNTVRLQLAFPEVAAELQARYDAPGGILPGEPGWEEVQQARGRLDLHTSAEPRGACICEGRAGHTNPACPWYGTDTP